METKIVKMSYHFACKKAHITSLIVIAATAVMLALSSFVTNDITAIILFFSMFAGVIFRCMIDWLYVLCVIANVAFDTAVQKIEEMEVE